MTNTRYIIVIGLIALVAVSVTLAFVLEEQPADEPLTLEVPPSPTLEPVPTTAPTATPAPIFVFVSGAVHHVGVYALPPGSRIVDALRAAGGPTEDAAIESLNQAILLTDQMQIHMPTRDDVLSTPPPISNAPSSPSDESTESQTTQTSSNEQININTATAAALESLPGIGPAIAQTIIDHRNTNGPFTSIEEIKNVKGIGDKFFEKIQDKITVE